MIQSNQKTSLLIPSQLPAFIRDDPAYSNFVLFLQAYYEWLETENNITDRSKNILNYTDVDNTTSEFLQYFYNDFLSYFPQDLLEDPTKNIATILKIARQLYQAKGSTASYKFLFKLLFNSDVEVFYTKDAVLRASSGKWYVATYLNILTTDSNFSNLQNYKVFGETSKSIAGIENSVIGQNKSQIYINNLQRGFQSGEFVRIIDQNNQDVYFLNGVQSTQNTPGAYLLRAKIVGQINKVTPTSPGSLYQTNDPVVFYGGLANPLTSNGASASIGTTTTGSVQSITVTKGGYGYRPSPNTTIAINAVGSSVVQPTANIPSYGVDTNYPANVAFLPTDTIGSIAGNNITIGAKQYYFSANVIANVSCSLANAFTFTAFTTYPISSVVVTSSGSGIQSISSVIPQSLYNTSNTLTSNSSYASLKSAGILAPIQIVSGGTGYSNSDTIVITGGTGFGAYAKANVNASGSIVSVNYVYSPLDTDTLHRYPLGGMGYTPTGLPAITVTSSGGTNASLIVPGILGDGAQLTSTASSIGQVQQINITNFGQDYSSLPNVSLQIQDVFVSNVSSSLLPARGDFVYQSVSGITTYTAFVDSITAYDGLGKYILRVYNYVGSITPTNALSVNGKNINMSIMTTSLPNSRYATNGVLTYGDGTAQAQASFVNGLIQAQGQYLDTTGQPSSFDILQSIDYNNFTYELTTEAQIESYRKTLLDLLHPSGMRLLGRYNLISNNNTNMVMVDALNQSPNNLADYVGVQAYVTISSDGTAFNRTSNNIIKFNSIGSANLATFVFPNSSIRFVTANGDPIVVLSINSINFVANTITASRNIWTTFANVATVTSASATNKINITSLTNSYDIAFGGYYTTNNKVKDIVRTNDIIKVNNQTATVTSVDYINNIITVGSTLTYSANGYMSVNRTWTSNNATLVQIFGPRGISYVPELTDELGNILTTENGIELLLG